MAALQKAAAGVTRVGWVGTGVMGAAMCGQLIKGGFSATVYNRTASKAQGLVDAVRARRARSPARSPQAADRSSPPPALPPVPLLIDLGAPPPARASYRPRSGRSAVSPGLPRGRAGARPSRAPPPVPLLPAPLLLPPPGG